MRRGEDRVELKPCPFCGSGNIVESYGLDDFMRCEDCDAEGPSAHKFKLKTAGGAWNRRITSETKKET